MNDIELNWTNPNGTKETVKVSKEQLLRMLKAGSEPAAQPAAAPAAVPAPVAPAAPDVEPCDMAMQLANLAQLQAQALRGARLNEFQKCQLDPDRMKWWALGLPLGGAIVGGALTAFAMSVCGED